MPRMTACKRSKLESFWRVHLDGWRRSDLNQRDYCELHGLPLKRFGNWRAQLRHEEPTSAGKLLYPIEVINQAYDALQSGETLRSVVTF